MIYEIVNMSDAYTIDCPDKTIAAVACCVLGEGQYMFKTEDDNEDEEIPFFMFGGLDKWFQQTFGKPANDVVEDIMANRRDALADCLDSCLIGDFGDRAEYESAIALIESPENKEKFRAQRHDKRRSSMNDIGGRAYQIAKRLRGEPGAAPRAPKQVHIGC